MSENCFSLRDERQGIRVDRQREKTGMQEANFFETREMYLEGSALPPALFPFSSPSLSYPRERRGNQYMRLLFHYLSTLFTTVSTSTFVLEYPTIEFLVIRMSLHSYDIVGYIFRIVAFHRRIGPFANMRSVQMRARVPKKVPCEVSCSRAKKHVSNSCVLIPVENSSRLCVKSCSQTSYPLASG